MNRNLLLLLGGGAAVIALTVDLTWPSSKPGSVGDPSKYRYMHCPECKRESMYTPAAFEKPCLYCEKHLVATEESIKKTGAPTNPYSRMFLLGFVELLAVMAGVWFVCRPRTENPEEDFLYINCEECNQKIRYRVQQVGQMAMCRRCKHPFAYPEEG